jgi:hypothetical protein
MSSTGGIYAWSVIIPGNNLARIGSLESVCE